MIKVTMQKLNSSLVSGTPDFTLNHSESKRLEVIVITKIKTVQNNCLPRFLANRALHQCKTLDHSHAMEFLMEQPKNYLVFFFNRAKTETVHIC